MTLKQLHDELGRMLASEVPPETPVILKVDSHEDEPGTHFDYRRTEAATVEKLAETPDGDLVRRPRDPDRPLRAVVIGEAVPAV